MEYLPDGSPADLMSDRRPWSTDATLPLLDQVAAALALLGLAPAWLIGNHFWRPSDWPPPR
jgi:hypothetical protein